MLDLDMGSDSKNHLEIIFMDKGLITNFHLSRQKGIFRGKEQESPHMRRGKHFCITLIAGNHPRFNDMDITPYGY